MNDEGIYRKASIGNKLTKLFTDNPDFSAANLLHTVLRSKNIRNGGKNSYDMSDDDLLIAIESTLKELRQKENNG